MASPAPPGVSFQGQGDSASLLDVLQLGSCSLTSHWPKQVTGSESGLDTQSDLSKVGSQDRRMENWGATLFTSLTHSGHVVKTTSFRSQSCAIRHTYTLLFVKR